MNRRDFFTRASLAVAGIAATCGLLPQPAHAELPVIPVEPMTMNYGLVDVMNMSDEQKRRIGLSDHRLPPGQQFFVDPNCLRKMELADHP